MKVISLELVGDGFERFNVACPRSVLKQALEQLESAIKEIKVTVRA